MISRWSSAHSAFHWPVKGRAFYDLPVSRDKSAVVAGGDHGRHSTGPKITAMLGNGQEVIKDTCRQSW